MIINNIVSITIIGLVILSGCGPKTIGTSAQNKAERIPELQETNKSTTETQLSQGQWQIKQMNNTSLKSASSKLPMIKFNIEENSIHGFTGCNNYFGKYEIIDDRTIRFSNIGATKMFCTETMEIENDFLEIINNTQYYEISEKQLLLFDKNKNQIAVLEYKE